MTPQELEHSFPGVHWREPIKISSSSLNTDFGCRVCIALYGLHASEIGTLPQTPDEFKQHIQTHFYDSH